MKIGFVNENKGTPTPVTSEQQKIEKIPIYEKLFIQKLRNNSECWKIPTPENEVN